MIEAGHGEGEGDGEADEAQVEHGRVEGDQRVVLQERVGARAVGRDGARDGAEGVGGADHQQEEERRHHVGDERRPADQRVVDAGPVLAGHGRDVAGQDEGPQDDRALRGPTTCR